jgi:superfamily II DNA or RNA helicase
MFDSMKKMFDKGYNGNPLLKKARRKIEWTPEMVEEYIKCAQDPIYFAEKYIQIVHVDHGLIPIKLYDYQKEIVTKLTNNRRVTVVTSRQAGKTTTAAAIIQLLFLLTRVMRLVKF